MATKVFIETSSITQANISGIGHTLISILRAWQEDGAASGAYEPILIVPFDKYQQIKKLKLPFTIKRIYMPDRAIRALRKYNLLPYMDIFFGRGIYLFPNFWNWPLLRSKSLTYVYDVSFLVHPEFSEPSNQKFLAKYLPVWLKRTDKIITISNHAKAEIVKYCQVNQSKVAVVYNGVQSSSELDLDSKLLADTKGRYGIHGKYILFVGNIEPRKNIQRLVAAYRLLPGSLKSEYSLVIVGAYGWNNEAIKLDIEKARSESLNVNKVAKFVNDDDLRVIYSGATILAHPALYEGFGMTPLEAMAAGVPVLVGNNSSLPEVVGDAGLYVDAMNVDDISAKIRELLENPSKRLELQREGIKRARKFTWARTVNSLIDVMEELSNE